MAAKWTAAAAQGITLEPAGHGHAAPSVGGDKQKSGEIDESSFHEVVKHPNQMQQ